MNLSWSRNTSCQHFYVHRKKESASKPHRQVRNNQSGKKRKKLHSIDLGSSKASSSGLCTRCFQHIGHSDVAHSSITGLGHGKSILVEALLGVFPKSGKSISLGVLGVSLRVLFDEPFSGNHDWHAGLSNEIVAERAE